MECQHKRTRKLFWMDSNPKCWKKTIFSICLDCKDIVYKKSKNLINPDEIEKDFTEEELKELEK